MPLTGLPPRGPSLRDVERALLTELGRCATSGSAPSSWSIWLAPRDYRRRGRRLPSWSEQLAARLRTEQGRLGLAAPGPVTVSFCSTQDLIPAHFQVQAGSAEPASWPPGPDSAGPTVAGRPRLTVAAGGTVRAGSPAARGRDQEVLLPLGTLVIGRSREADLMLPDPSVSPRHAEVDVGPDVVRLRDLGSLNGTLVDGAPVSSVDLVNGNRIDLGVTALVFHRDPAASDPSG